MGECQTMCCTYDGNVQRDHNPMMEQSSAIEYNGQKFIISDKINFESQATFTKVEQAARAFCQSTTPTIKKIISPPSISPSSAE